MRSHDKLASTYLRSRDSLGERSHINGNDVPAALWPIVRARGVRTTRIDADPSPLIRARQNRFWPATSMPIFGWQVSANDRFLSLSRDMSSRFERPNSAINYLPGIFFRRENS